MDIASLLYRYRPVRQSDFRRKVLGLQAGYAVAKSIDGSISMDRFLDWSGELIWRNFGGPAQDSYLTTAFSVVRSFQPHIDPFLASVLNGIVLEMNFQTRQTIDGVAGPQEAVLFEGSPDLFPIAMLHGNATLGVHVTDRSNGYEPPVWANAHPALEVNFDRIRQAGPEYIADACTTAGANRLGAVLMAEPQLDWGTFNLAKRYAGVANMVSRHTIYCLGGAAEMVVATAREVQERYPDVGVFVRLYSQPFGGATKHCGILVFAGLSQLPSVEICAGVRQDFTFGEARSKTGHSDESVEIVDYALGRVDGPAETRTLPDGSNEVVGRWEAATIKLPSFLFSSAPLPEEARERISEGHGIFHSLAKLTDGILIPSQDPSHATYLHATSGGRIVTDFGDEGRNVEMSPLYRGAAEDSNGVRHGTLIAPDLLRVRGAAMPLMFTPMLHKWHSHFMIQCLPRVRIVRELIADGLEEDVKILLPSDMRAKQLEMLSVLGFGEDRVVLMPPGAVVQADALYVPRAWRLAFTPYSTAIYQEIGEKFLKDTVKTPKRVLISRESRKTWRNLLNFEAIRELLVGNYGFELVAPESLSLEEEVATYANAEIVVGAEGAGMYGAVFSSPRTTYITICDEDYVMPILATLANVRGFDIGYVFGESLRADSDLERRLPFGHADFFVDLEKVERAVQVAISKTSWRS